MGSCVQRDSGLGRVGWASAPAFCGAATRLALYFHAKATPIQPYIGRNRPPWPLGVFFFKVWVFCAQLAVAPYRAVHNTSRCCVRPVLHCRHSRCPTRVLGRRLGGWRHPPRSALCTVGGGGSVCGGCHITRSAGCVRHSKTAAATEPPCRPFVGGALYGGVSPGTGWTPAARHRLVRLRRQAVERGAAAAAAGHVSGCSTPVHTSGIGGCV